MTSAAPRPRPLPKLDRVIEYARRFPECDAEAMRTYLQVRMLQTRLDHALDAHLARHRLSFGRFMVLVQLVQAEGHSAAPAQLSEVCGVTRATMTGLLDTLQKAKLVAREADPDDGRSVVVRLTIGGRRFLEKMLPDHYTRLTAMMSVLSRPQMKQLQRLLLRVGEGVPALEAR
jgi:DNA-binding MarR family transcriptional regulator